MSIARTFRPFLVAAAAAACSPAWSQSYYHAPPGPNDAPLLPSINPARFFEPVAREAGLWPRRKQVAAQPAPSAAPANPMPLAAAPTPPPAPAHTNPAPTAALNPAPARAATTQAATAQAATAAAPAPARFSPEPNVRPIAGPAQTRWVRLDEAGNPIAQSPPPARPATARRVPSPSPEPRAVAASFSPPPAPPAEPASVAEPTSVAAAAPAVLPSAAALPSPPPVPVPATPAAVRTLVAQRLAEGSTADAEAILVQATARFASDADLALTLARLRESRENWTGAAEAYSAVMRLSPRDAKWRLRRADCLYFAEDFVAAVADYEAAAAENPQALSLDEYTRFGDAALRSGNPATAEAAFTAISRTAEEPVARVELLRGLAALKQGDAARARDILLRANARWPRDRALTDALRLAAAVHYGDRAPLTAKTEPRRESEPTAAPILTTAAETPAAESMEPAAQSVEPAAESAEEVWHAPSRWRRSRDADPTTAGWRSAKPSELVEQAADAEPARLP